MKKIHIVFSEPAAATMATELSEEVFCFQDILSIGPIMNLEIKDGKEKRIAFMKKVFNKTEFKEFEKEIGINKLLSLIFYDYDKVIVWHSDHADDKLLLCLVCAIIPQSMELYEVDVAHTLRKNGCTCVPSHTAGCTPSDIKIASKWFSSMPPEHILSYKVRWRDASKIDSSLRMWNNKVNTIVHLNEDYFDEELIAECNQTFQSAGTIVGNVMGKNNDKYQIGDTFLAYRLITLIEQKQLIAQGDLNFLWRTKIKLPW